MKLTTPIRQNIKTLAMNEVGRKKIQVTFLIHDLRNEDGTPYEGMNLALAHKDEGRGGECLLHQVKQDIQPSSDGSVIIDVQVDVWSSAEGDYTLDGGDCFKVRIAAEGTCTRVVR